MPAYYESTFFPLLARGTLFEKTVPLDPISANIINSKHEIRNPKQIQMTEIQMTKTKNLVSN